MSASTARRLHKREFMETRSHIAERAAPVLTNIACSVGNTGYWRAALIISTAAFLIMALATQLGKGAQLEKGVEVAFSRARQLLHEADKENRNVRPLPLSLAKVLYIPDTGQSHDNVGSPVPHGPRLHPAPYAASGRVLTGLRPFARA
jgi:hypothetical protein